MSVTSYAFAASLTDLINFEAYLGSAYGSVSYFNYDSSIPQVTVAMASSLTAGQFSSLSTAVAAYVPALSIPYFSFPTLAASFTGTASVQALVVQSYASFLAGIGATSASFSGTVTGGAVVGGPVSGTSISTTGTTTTGVLSVLGPWASVSSVLSAATITSPFLSAGTITTTSLSAGTITTTSLATGTITTNSLLVTGNMTVNGTVTSLNTVTTLSSMIDIENSGGGPAIRVVQTSGIGPIAYYISGTASAATTISAIYPGSLTVTGTVVAQALVASGYASVTTSVSTGTVVAALGSISGSLYVGGSITVSNISGVNLSASGTITGAFLNITGAWASVSNVLSAGTLLAPQGTVTSLTTNQLTLLKITNSAASAANSIEVYMDAADSLLKSMNSSTVLTVYAPQTTLGDIAVHNGTFNTRVAVGSNNTVLMADATQPNGLKWAQPVFGALQSYAQSLGTNSTTSIALQTKLSLVTGALLTGTYAVNTSYSLFSPINVVGNIVLVVDAATTISNNNIQCVAGSYPTIATDFAQVALAAGTHSLVLQYATRQAGIAVNIDNAKIALNRIS